jgi:acetate kinase
MRDIIEKAASGDEDCRLAVLVFAHRLRKYIGAYAAVMGGADAIVFTGGIGENSNVVRQRVTQRMEYMGILSDEDLNNDLRLSDDHPFAFFNASNSRVKLIAIKTDEEKAIAAETSRLVNQENKVNTIPTIPIAISARHIHLTQEVVEQVYIIVNTYLLVDILQVGLRVVLVVEIHTVQPSLLVVMVGEVMEVLQEVNYQLTV